MMGATNDLGDQLVGELGSDQSDDCYKVCIVAVFVKLIPGCNKRFGPAGIIMALSMILALCGMMLGITGQIIGTEKLLAEFKPARDQRDYLI